ncbi:MAG: DUF928 domain-containing protein [Cyanobacteria bacterium P01_B01_bin.77]
MYQRLIQKSGIFSIFACLAFQVSAEALPPIPDGYKPETPSGHNDGGRRDSCPRLELEPPMTTLTPGVYNRGGLTQAAQPALWLYLPFDIPSDTSPEPAIQLTIKKTTGDFETIFEATFVAPDLQQGFVGIPLSSTEVVLPLDEPLEWTFKLYCGGIEDISEERAPYFVKAWITRIDSSTLAQPLPETTSVQDLSEAYRDSALWYDALGVLGESILEASPATNTRSLWRQLLVDGGFEAIANEPHIQYLTIPAE